MADLPDDKKNDSRNNGQPSKKVQLIEVSVFLFLIMPSMALSFFRTDQAALSFPVVAGVTILQDLALLSLVLYVIWRNGEPLKAIGWTLANARREAVLGLGLFLPFFFMVSVLQTVLRSAGFSAPEAPPSYLIPSGSAQILLALAFLAVVAVAEETIFRGYLLLRFQSLMGNPTGAVLLSALIFSIGHGYQGSVGVITVAAIGLFLAVVYLWRGSLIAPIVMHFLQNFIGIFLAPNG